LNQEKAIRTKKYNTLKPKIQQLLTDLEKLPTNSVERTINDDKMPILSSEFLQKCEEVESYLEREVEGNRVEAEVLREGIKDLKRRLKEEPDMDSIPDGFKPSILIQVCLYYLLRLILLQVKQLLTKKRCIVIMKVINNRYFCTFPDIASCRTRSFDPTETGELDEIHY
jgi:hypothetical protein